MKSENPRTQGGYPYNIFEAHQNPWFTGLVVPSWVSLNFIPCPPQARLERFHAIYKWNSHMCPMHSDYPECCSQGWCDTWTCEHTALFVFHCKLLNLYLIGISSIWDMGHGVMTWIGTESKLMMMFMLKPPDSMFFDLSTIDDNMLMRDMDMLL